MKAKSLTVSMPALSMLFGCKETDKERLTRLVTEWQGKKIVFPENPVFTRYVVDTVDYQIPQSGYKVLVYVNSTGCTGCKLQLHKLNKFDLPVRQRQ